MKKQHCVPPCARKINLRKAACLRICSPKLQTLWIIHDERCHQVFYWDYSFRCKNSWRRIIQSNTGALLTEMPPLYNRTAANDTKKRIRVVFGNAVYNFGEPTLYKISWSWASFDNESFTSPPPQSCKKTQKKTRWAARRCFPPADLIKKDTSSWPRSDCECVWLCVCMH